MYYNYSKYYKMKIQLIFIFSLSKHIHVTLKHSLSYSHSLWMNLIFD